MAINPDKQATIPVNEIILEQDRLREDYGDKDESAEGMEALKEDILQNEQIQPIAVEYRSAEKKHYVIVGARRYLAIRLLHFEGKHDGSVYCRIFHDLTPEGRKVVELCENVKRRNMNFREIAVSVYEIHELNVKKHGEHTGGGVAGGWSQSATARQLGFATSYLTPLMFIARVLKSADKELKELVHKAGNYREAVTLVKGKQEDRKRARKAKAAETKTKTEAKKGTKTVAELHAERAARDPEFAVALFIRDWIADKDDPRTLEEARDEAIAKWGDMAAPFFSENVRAEKDSKGVPTVIVESEEEGEIDTDEESDDFVEEAPAVIDLDAIRAKAEATIASQAGDPEPEAPVDTDDAAERRAALIDSYRLGDFFEGAAGLESGTFDLAEVDPPYGIEFTNLITHSPTERDKYQEVDRDEYGAFLKRLISECFRLLKPTGWMVLWHAEEWCEFSRKELIDTGFRVARIPGCWAKLGSPGSTRNPRFNLGSAYERFHYARKAEAELFAQGVSNTLPYPRVPQAGNKHLTERPIELMSRILLTFSPPESNILVPFLGSGNTLLAAHNHGRTAVGWDVQEDYRNQFILKVTENPDDKPFRSYAKEIGPFEKAYRTTVSHKEE